ncbi:hypothetical protein [Microvirga arabica]|nr:hypothetical protein [Microvirga arabica]MBM1169943.1 hypothetical protein [Microvirga arabica]
MPQTYQRFTKEFQDEAVRLALTSGRSRPARRHSTLDYVSPVQFERLTG